MSGLAPIRYQVPSSSAISSGCAKTSASSRADSLRHGTGAQLKAAAKCKWQPLAAGKDVCCEAAGVG
eukprot:scaffold1102_cov116-Isochrysis_galbana.AAC.1